MPAHGNISSGDCPGLREPRRAGISPSPLRDDPAQPQLAREEQRGKGSSQEGPGILLEVMEAETPPALGEAAPPDPVGLRYFTSVEDLISCSRYVFELSENSAAKCLPV